MTIESSQTLPIYLRKSGDHCEIVCTQTDRLINRITKKQALFLAGELKCHNGGPVYDMTMSLLILGHDFDYAYNQSVKLVDKATHEEIMGEN